MQFAITLHSIIYTCDFVIYGIHVIDSKDLIPA